MVACARSCHAEGDRNKIQAQAFIDVPYLPLGEYFEPTATRKSLTGVLKGLPLFWNVKKEA